jgi:hypothetical protein
LITEYLLGGFNNGNAETRLHNAKRVAENDKFEELAGIQEESNGTRGKIWSGTIEHRKNYSSYNSARGQKDSEGNIEYYTDKYGKQTETERDYSEYYSGTTEGTKKKVRMKFQLKTRL